MPETNTPILDDTTQLYFEVEHLVLRRWDGEEAIDLEPLWSNITISENVYSPTITGTVTILDAVGILQDYIRGEEKLFISFRSINSDTPIYLDFHVTGVKAVQANKHQLSATYVLELVTKELYLSKLKNINFAINDTISTVVTNLYNDNLKDASPIKPISVSPTTGVQDIIIPGKDVIDAIKWLGRRAYSSDWQSSVYSFFQSNRGFYFYNIEQLIDEKKREVIEKYYHNPWVHHTGTESHIPFYNILDLTITQVNDTLKTLGAGSLATNVVDYDFITKQVNLTEFKGNHATTKNFDDEGEWIHSGKFLNDVINYDSSAHSTHIKTIDSSKNPDYLTEMIGPRTFYMTKLNSIQAIIEIYGNSDLQAGDLMDIELVNPVDTEDASKKYKFSGRWWITSITHNISQQDYKQNVSIMKNCLNINTDINEIQ